MSSPVTTTTNAVQRTDPRTQKFLDLRNFLTTRKDQVGAIAGRALDTERVLKIVLDAAASTPKLLACSPESLLRAMMFCAKVRLEPIGARGVWLVPYGDQVTPIIDYRAMVELVKRSGDVRTIVAHPVYENDVFNVVFGDDEAITHTPVIDSDKRGKMIAVYAIATLKDGARQRVVLGRADVDRYRAKSRASGNGPWVTDYEAMAMKTAIKRLCNLLPVPLETAQAIDEDDAPAFEPQITIDGETGEVLSEAPAPAATKAIKDELRARRDATPAVDVGAGPEAPAEEEGEPDPKWTSADTDALRTQLDGLFASLVDLAGESKAKAMWAGNRGPGSLRGVRSQAHADKRLDAARALLEAAKRAE